jgi:lipopolysaccharide/colanic/teichoic acid biosynthesis glycosyltransferase
MLKSAVYPLLAILIVLLIWLALAIELDSAGSVFRQMREEDLSTLRELGRL